VERFDRSRPDRLEFVRVFFERSARKLDRDEFTRRIAALCAKQFPHDTVESFSSHQDLEHSLSGNYPVVSFVPAPRDGRSLPPAKTNPPRTPEGS